MTVNGKFGCGLLASSGDMCPRLARGAIRFYKDDRQECLSYLRPAPLRGQLVNHNPSLPRFFRKH